MYLEDYDGADLSGIGSKLKKAAKKIRKSVRKTTLFSVSPSIALTAGQRKRIIPGVSRITGRAVAMVKHPLSFLPKNTPKMAPAATVPEVDFDGTEMTQSERNAVIDSASPTVEPFSSGYYGDEIGPEQTFGPEVPGIIQPEDLAPASEAKPAPKLTLPLLGGVLLLLNFL
jgi:hypothetical protein